MISKYDDYSELWSYIKFKNHMEKLEKDLSTVHHYEISTATAYTKSFSHICDVLNLDGKSTKEELLKEDVLDEEWLSAYVDWEVLELEYDTHYHLTDLGKIFYLKNKAWRKKHNAI